MQRNVQNNRKQNSGGGTGSNGTSNNGAPTPTKTARRNASAANSNATVSKPVAPQQPQQQQRSTAASTSTRQVQASNGQPSSTHNTSTSTRTSATATASTATAVGQQQQIPIRSGPGKNTAAAAAPVAATGPAKKTAAAATTAAPKYPDLKNERYIAELAVQRVVLATKTVLNSILPLSPDAPSFGAALGQVKMAGAKAAGAASGATAGAIAVATAVAKADDSPVTIADFAGQALLIAALNKAFPRDGFLGEETAKELRANPAMAEKVWQLVKATKLADAERETLLGRPKSKEEMLALIDLGGSVETAVPGKRYWVMDPLDGTSAFLQGGQYAVALGLVQNGREILGVVACPNLPYERWVVGEIHEAMVGDEGLGIMMAAVRGHGVTIRKVGKGKLGKSAQVDRSGLRQPPITEPYPGPAKFKKLVFVDSENSPKTRVDKLKLFTGGCSGAVQLYSSHVRYAVMALGDRSWTQIRWPKAPNEKGKGRWSIWDHVGTPLIYTQSGPGVVTDLLGNNLRYDEGRNLESTWGVITADATMHRQIVDMVAAMPKF
ncbi:uncharacterized protein C8A04DRAFT_15835 [Dichotomopilus funicola]|uniref:3'(2'),5'-bisphosphate nucleotidase n=1 Tax=Dichotomopilus funicola TaxID=1934379 RepID=A0AAN6ZJ40_9PEZI|nr:hypothetical protein C8A04DRAFT_15835 [Dichotomopilus funicola]